MENETAMQMGVDPGLPDLPQVRDFNVLFTDLSKIGSFEVGYRYKFNANREVELDDGSKLKIYYNITVDYISDKTILTLFKLNSTSTEVNLNDEVPEPVQSLYGVPVTENNSVKYFKRELGNMDNLYDWLLALQTKWFKEPKPVNRFRFNTQDKVVDGITTKWFKLTLEEVKHNREAKKDTDKDSPKIQEPVKPAEESKAKPTGRIRHRGRRIVQKVTNITVQSGGIVNINV